MYWSNDEEDYSFKEDDVYYSDCEEDYSLNEDDTYYSDCEEEKDYKRGNSFLTLSCKCGQVMPLYGSIQCGSRVLHILDYIYLYKTYMSDRLKLEYNCEKCKITKKTTLLSRSIEYHDAKEEELHQVNDYTFLLLFVYLKEFNY